MTHINYKIQIRLEGFFEVEEDWQEFVFQRDDSYPPDFVGFNIDNPNHYDTH